MLGVDSAVVEVMRVTEVTGEDFAMTRVRARGRGIDCLVGAVAAILVAGGITEPIFAAESAKGKTSALKSASTQTDKQIEKGIAAYEAGKIDLAVQELTSAISSGKISQSKLAQALYYRGLAYRKQNRPAQAISDFTSALWIKDGLDAEQRSNALLNRAAAYRDAGLNEQAEADEKRVAATRQPRAKANAETAAASTAAESPSPASSGSGLTGFFNALFGGASSNPPQSAASAPSSRSGEAAGAPRAATQQTSAWSSTWGENTVVRKAGNGGGNSVPATTASTSKAAAQGSYVIQVAAVRTKQEAQAVAKRLRQLGGSFGAREPGIEEAVMGNMGTLYRVSLGPFASSGEVEKVCPQLRQAGLDCHIISR